MACQPACLPACLLLCVWAHRMTHSVLYTRAPSLSFNRATRAQPPVCHTRTHRHPSTRTFVCVCVIQRPETSSGPSPPALTSSFAEQATGAVTFANTPRFHDLEKRGRRYVAHT